MITNVTVRNSRARNSGDLISMTTSIPRIVGHRGARGEAPENTLPAFLIARELGIDEVELDVHLSSDDQLVVIHDNTLQRTTGEKGHVQRYTAQQLGNLDARVGTPGWPSPTGIPSLREVVDCCGPRMRFQFEVKSAGVRVLRRLAGQLVALIEEQQLAPRVIVTSSHTGLLRLVGDLAPGLERGYVGEYRHLHPVRRAAALGCSWVMPRYRLIDEVLMQRARQQRLKVSAWTVNDENEARRLADLGVDSIITDFPTRLAASRKKGFRN